MVNMDAKRVYVFIIEQRNLNYERRALATDCESAVRAGADGCSAVPLVLKPVGAASLSWRLAGFNPSPVTFADLRMASRYAGYK